jgi:hypothetical protein
MSDTREAYEALVNAGVSEDRARDIVRDEVGQDPARLTSAVVTLRVSITVDLEESDLDGLNEDDLDAMISIAEDKFDVSGWNVSLDSVDDAEVDDIVSDLD